MGLLGWVMMGLAIWHYTIFLPDRFWGGIVGAFVGSLVGADIAVVLYAVPGALIGIAIVYLEGVRRERASGIAPAHAE